MAEKPTYEELERRIAKLASEHARAEETLRKSEERFRQVLFSGPDAMNLNLFEDGTYIDINEGFT